MSEERAPTGGVPPDDFRRTLGNFATGVCVVTATDRESGPVGITVNSFTSLSLNPPLVLFCLDESSTRYDAFARAHHFTINVLREDQAGLSMAFASKTHPDWDGIGHQISKVSGCPVLDGTLAAIQCRRHAMHVEGDHCILIGEAIRLDAGTGGYPLLYFDGTYHRIETHGER